LTKLPDSAAVIASDISKHLEFSGGPPRILIIMPSIPLHGMERANVQIMRLLKCAGAEILVVTESRWGSAVSEAVQATGCSQVGIELERGLTLPKGPIDFLRTAVHWICVSWRIRSIFRDFRPTHLYFTNVSFFLLALPLPGRKDVKTIFRLPNPPEIDLHGWRQRLSDALWKHVVVPRCNVFVTNSSYSREKLRRLVGRDTCVELIYNSYPRRPESVVSDAPRIARDRFNVVYVGRIRRAKGVDLLHEAAVRLVRRHNDIDFYFVGEHSWRNPFAESLIADTASRGLGDRILFLDHVEDIPELLAQAHLHVCPSTSSSESLPNVILEAKFAGTPSVVFPVAGLPEAVVHDTEGSICSEISSEALIEAIEKYKESPDLVKRHARGARRSLRRFDDEKITREWMRLFADG